MINNNFYVIITNGNNYDYDYDNRNGNDGDNDDVFIITINNNNNSSNNKNINKRNYPDASAGSETIITFGVITSEILLILPIIIILNNISRSSFSRRLLLQHRPLGVANYNFVLTARSARCSSSGTLPNIRVDNVFLSDKRFFRQAMFFGTSCILTFVFAICIFLHHLHPLFTIYLNTNISLDVNLFYRPLTSQH